MPFPSISLKRGTSSKFSVFKKDKEVALPKASAHETVPEDTTPKESRKATSIKESETIDTKVETDTGRNKEKADRKELTGDKAGRKDVKNNEALTSNRTVTQAAPEGVYSLFWANKLTYNLRAKSYSRTASFIPNAMALQELLYQAAPIVGRSKYILKHEATYNEYAVATGYMILYYIQILRAKQAASNLDGIESNLLTRLFKMHPEESIPIAEPLFPYFNTIVSTELEDRRYNWISPDYQMGGANVGAASMHAFTASHGRHFIQPQVPQMLGILATFGSHDETELQARINSAGVYTPHDLAAQTPLFKRAAGARLDFTDAAGAADANHLTLAACGISYPFRFFNQNANEARLRMAETDFYGPKGVDFGATVAGAGDIPSGLTANPTFETIDYFLNMQKTKNLKWFGYIKEQMAIYSKCFKTQYNLSQVGTTGGLESSVILHLRTSDAVTTTQTAHLYPTVLLNYTHPNQLRWYPRKFTNMTAHAQSSRAGVDRNEELQAITFGTNSTPPIVIAANHIAQYREGKYFEHAQEGAGLVQVIGTPTSTDEGPLDMFDSWASDVIAKCFNPSPAH